MKNFRFLLTIALSLSIAFTLASCGGGASETATDKTGKEYTSAYICPMHCKDSGSDKAGKCPVCNMDYVQNENYKAPEGSHEGHDHGSHEGHDHGSHEGHNH